MSEQYFASAPADECVSTVMKKADHWYNFQLLNGLHDKMYSSWKCYHGAYYDNLSYGHRVSFGGEQGELTQIPVNHYRNIADHVINMTAASRPSMEARAVNTDHVSLVQTYLANGILDYYMREKDLENYIKKAVDYAVVMGAGFVKLEWDATAGEIYDYEKNEETGEPDTSKPLYEGDVVFTNLSPFDVVYDSHREDHNHDFVTVRSFKNKYDLAAKYPDLSNEIVSVKTKSDIINLSIVTGTNMDNTDLVPVYEFFHKKTPSVPEGRYILFLSENVILYDGPNPYRDLPIIRIAPSDFMGTTYGYTPLFDLIPLQEAVNSIYSGILTNQNAFLVQSLWVPKGADIDQASLTGGLNIIEGNPGFKPEPIQFTATPKESFEFLDHLVRDMETISGVNSVARGNPEASLRSGTALALVQSLALQFSSKLQAQYVKAVERIGTILIRMLQDFATTKRAIALISGESNKSYVEEFSNDDISNISRVVVDLGNPLARCLGIDTPILMYDGSIKKVQDIKIGDVVMGPDSGPRTVNNVNSGTEMMYEVTSKDSKRNVKYSCNESHILTLKYCSDDYRYDAQRGDIIDVTVKDYLKLTERQKRLLQGFKTGIEFTKKPLAIPPYILGAWLGDGHSSNTALTSMDQEVIKEWSDYALSIGMQIREQENRQPNKSSVYFITSGQMGGISSRNVMKNHLDGYELINNKHIPKNYLTSERKDRLELLAGLIDTDGYRLDETYIFTQKNDVLSNDVIFLAESLGFRVTHSKVPNSKSKLCPNSEGEVNKITIGGNTWEIPCRIPRKKSTPKQKSRNWLNYGIQVNPIGINTYYGFTLEEEPHFVLGDFTVTHNTTSGKLQLAESLVQYGLIKDPQQYLTVVNTGKLEVATEDTQRHLWLIKSENESLIKGKKPKAIATDIHAQHIQSHSSVLDDAKLREDPTLVANTLEHIQEHMELWTTTNPQLLAATKQAPPPPSNGPEITQQQVTPNGSLPPQEAVDVPGIVPNKISGPGIEEGVRVPNPANPPKPFKDLPMTPAESIQQQV